MKKMNKKGFTLMEMLIVIAIIAILIAIAIPTFTAALEKSRQKTDLANARALKSLVVAQYMAGEEDEADGVRAKLTSGSFTFYLNTNGQEIAYAKDGSMEITATWSGTPYAKNGSTKRYINCTFNADCKMTGSQPKLPGES